MSTSRCLLALLGGEIPEFMDNIWCLNEVPEDVFLTGARLRLIPSTANSAMRQIKLKKRPLHR